MADNVQAPPLIELKNKYKKVLVVPVGEVEVYFKLPTWGEYKTYIKFLQTGLVDKLNLFEYIFKENVLNEELVDKMYSMPAGLVDTVVELILRLAGNPLFTQEDIDRLNYDINQTRELVANNILEQYIAVICRAFPSYKPHELDELDWQEFLRLLLLAETKLKMEISHVAAVSESQFSVIQWPEEANVNIQPKKEEKKKNLFDQIKDDTKRAMKEDPTLLAQNGPPRSRAEIEAVKRKQMEQMAQMRKQGKMPRGGPAR